MHYFALVFLVSAVSCSVIRDATQAEGQVERMKRELIPELLSILVDDNEKIASDSLVQGMPSDADIQRAIDNIGRQSQTFTSDVAKRLQDAGLLQPNSAHTSSVSMQVMMGTIIMALVKMMIGIA